MTSSALSPLGAPGVYRSDDVPLRRLTQERMDVAAFVGVAPRGASRVPLHAGPWEAPPAGLTGSRRSVARAVDSWDEYRRLFGGFEGPGLLPYAVASFFDQGGRRAWVVRIVHEYGDHRDEEAVAQGPVAGLFPAGAVGLPLEARSAGSVGQGTRARVRWRVTALPFVGMRGEIVVLDGTNPVPDLAAGSLLRLTTTDGRRRFAFIDSIAVSRSAGGARIRLFLAEELGGLEVTAAEHVQARITVERPDGAMETHDRLACSPEHPRWIATVLARDSALVRPDPRWLEDRLWPESVELTPPPNGEAFQAGGERSRARGKLPGLSPERDGLWLRARDEGAWGNRLAASISFRARDVGWLGGAGAFLDLPAGTDVGPGTLVRVDLGGGVRVLRFVEDVRNEWLGASDSMIAGLRAELDRPLPTPAEGVEIVEAELVVAEHRGRDELRVVERHRGLGLDPAHPRWIARVLNDDSELVHAHRDWVGLRLQAPPPELPDPDPRIAPFRGGRDRYDDIVPEDFFDPGWVPGDENPPSGFQAALEDGEAALLVVPDLYSPGPLPPVERVLEPASLAGPDFGLCREPPALGAQDAGAIRLPGLLLDPTMPGDRTRIVALQRRLVELAERVSDAAVLLDVPPGLSEREITTWRASFRSRSAAAYHPWLGMARTDDGRGALVWGNPSAVAAGIIARHEWRSGVQHGPANALAMGMVDVAERVPGERHDRLHPLGINVFLRERDGVRLAGARTLSLERDWRQLSVLRLMTMLTRTLRRQMQWVVFEPNGPRLREELKHALRAFLRQLQSENAFAGGTDEESFFIRADLDIGVSPASFDGRLLMEIGVAPAEPMEFIVLRLARSGDDILQVEG